MNNFPGPSKDKPANANQLSTIRILCEKLGVEDKSDESWSSYDASEEISRLNRLYKNRPIRGPRD